MEEVLLAIQKNQTWDLVNLLEGKKAIGLKWVFRTKYHADGSIQKHKARLVAKGYSQQQGIDFNETFSHVARFETVTTFLALAGKLNWPVYQFDVKSSFLYGDLEEEVYVSQPEGFVVNGKEDKFYRLKKALYGLKQAPRA
ncbi:Retrovirus-related Pol polyprotein from transposon TNT 1-94 [Capsicum chinense]|nr:Retrovirus-related Pol polyprotein from transposon TNT 1-94 [Capsicum chinense]